MGTPKAFANSICVYPFNFRKALIRLPIRSWSILRCPSFLFLEDHQGDVASSSLHPAIVNVERSLPKGLKQRPVHAFLGDRKSTRLNSSHVSNSYAVFCLKKNILTIY